MPSQHISRIRITNWRQINNLLTSELLLSSLEVSRTGRVLCHSLNWEEYWANLEVPPFFKPYLDDLRFARAGYIRSEFNLYLARTYCYAYFKALRQALNGIEDGSIDLRVLVAILGFENAAVYFSEDHTTKAALTSTARNPVYLLSKIRSPDACEDSKYLPITTHFDPAKSTGATSPLFFHYRQLASGETGQSRLLIFPPVAMKDRLAGFRCLHSLSNALSCKQDTRVRQRSARIAELAVGPILEKLWSNGTIACDADICIADLGAGSGDLTRRVITHLAGCHTELFQRHRLSWTLVDVSLSGMKRHAFNRRFSQGLSQLKCERSDYISWVERQRCSSNLKPFHLVLASRLLNNASLFSIGRVSRWREVRPLVGNNCDYFEWREGAYLPDVALRCGNLGCNHLVASNAKASFFNGLSYRQASLTDYFQGLSILMGKENMEAAPLQRPVFFPVRQFNETALDLPNGGSVLERLCSLSNAVVIEDVDLDAVTLRRLLQARGLRNLVASDTTERSRMHTANLLCVAERNGEYILPGRRLW